jgi:hypothetical protein
MNVGALDNWVKYHRAGNEQKVSVWLSQGPDAHADYQVWGATSASKEQLTYVVRYYASREGEQVVCSCPAGEYGIPCKHAALVLGRIHYRSFERLLRTPRSQWLRQRRQRIA